MYKNNTSSGALAEKISLKKTEPRKEMERE